MQWFFSLFSFFWPVQGGERKTFQLAFWILYFLGVADCLVRTLRDALLLTGTPHGAEALPFIDFWLVLPCAIATTALYSWLSRYISLNRLFVLTLFAFLVVFLLFAFLLYPAQDSLQASQIAIKLEYLLSSRFQGLITAIQFWPITFFCVVAALWKPLIIVVLFWGLMNRMASVEQACRLYGPLMLSHSLASLTGGQLSIFMRNVCAGEGISSAEAWSTAFQLAIVIVAVLGILSIALHERLHVEGVAVRPHGPDRSNPSLLKSFSLLARSPYLMGIVVFILADNIAYILMQPIWKYHLSQLYPNPLDYISYNGKINTCTACVTALLALGVTGQVIRRWGWTTAAMIAPIVLLLTSCGFFFFIIYKDQPTMQAMTAELWGVTPVAAGVFCGAICECFCRACKCTFLDTTKELAFVPLDTRTQSYAKATIDGVGERLGKAAGGLLQQGILICSLTIGSSAAPTALFMLGFVLIAIQAARTAGRHFCVLTKT